MDRMAMCAQTGMTRCGLFHAQPQIKSFGNGAEHGECGRSDFGADAVTGKDEEVHGYCPICGCPSSLFLQKRKRVLKNKGIPRVPAASCSQSNCVFETPCANVD